VILDGLKFNEERCKWTASYPFFIPPSELRDNYQQVKAYTERMEKRLRKQGRVEEFNSQFRDTVERGVFKELSEEELKEWKGPLNYIAYLAGMSPYISLKNKEKTLRASYDRGTQIFDYMD
jgi:hypothetical protein